MNSMSYIRCAAVLILSILGWSTLRCTSEPSTPKLDSRSSQIFSEGSGITEAETTTDKDVSKNVSSDETHHRAPHGGLLTPIGDHTAHLEWVFDQESGRINLYFLDGHGDASLIMALSSLPAEILISENQNLLQTNFQAVENPLTGETSSHSSVFECIHEELKLANTIQITIPSLQIKGGEVGPIQVSIKHF